MDFDQYVAARRSRLIEEAVARGCPAGEADELVEKVLQGRRREITRAEDPHPAMVEAVAAELSGEGEVRRTNLLTLLPVAALVVIAALVAAAVLLGGGSDDSGPNPGPTPGLTPGLTDAASPTASPSPGTVMPLLLGYDERQAFEALNRLGLVPNTSQLPACAPIGLVLGSLPTPGAGVEPGDQVTISTAGIATPQQCPPAQALAIGQAWVFVKYVIGRGPAPAFADRVQVVINGEAPRILGRAAASANGLGGLSQFFNGFSGIGAVSQSGEYPELTALRLTPPDSRCGVGRPTAFGTRPALSVSLESFDLGDDDVCALTVDLYQGADGIDGIALYQPPDAR